MKKRIALFMCVILLLAACAPQTQRPASQEAAVSAKETPSGPAGDAAPPEDVSAPEVSPPEQEAENAPDGQEQPESVPDAASRETPSGETASGEAAPVGFSGRVDAALTVYYDGDTPRFSQKLPVPPEVTFSGSSSRVTIERKTETGWEVVRGGGAGNFTLEGKLTVNGPLPPQVLDDAAFGTQYRITTVLRTGTGGEVTAVNTFRAGDSFADGATERAQATPDTFHVKTRVDMEGRGLLGFTQTVTNASGQTVLLDRSYTVLKQSDGGVWKVEAYPDGHQPDAQGTALLLPGASYTENGTLPITAAQARRGGKYRIVRTAALVGVQDPKAGIEFYADLEAGKTFREASGSQDVTPPVLEDAALVLEQTSFLAGDVPLGVWLENKSSDAIVAGKPRVYNVKDGENLLTGETLEFRAEIPAGGSLPVLDVPLALEPGEYTVEITVWPPSGGAEASLAKNFTVEADKLKNAASAATVEMKVALGGRDSNGLATFTQTFTNHSCQTLLAGRDFYVERPGGGLWVPADYPEGLKPEIQEDMVLLRPGASVTLEGTLPFMAEGLPDTYRITRTLMVDNPLPSQKNGLTLVYTVTKK